MGAVNAVMRQVIFALTLALATPLAGSQFVPLSIEALTQKAELIVHAKVSAKACALDETGRLITRVDLQVLEVWKGRLPANSFRVVHSGGEAGKRRTVVSGQVDYVVGEEVVAFLVLNRRGEGVTIGLSQGKFTVWTNRVTGQKLAASPFHGSTLGDSSAPLSVKTAASGSLSLADLKSRVTAGTVR